MKSSRTGKHSDSSGDPTGHGVFFFPDPAEYENLIRYAFAVDRENHMDLVHDSILSTTSFGAAKRFISGRKYCYIPRTEADLTKDLVTDQVCNKCNQVKPNCEFSRRKDGPITFLRGECRDCRREYYRIRWHRKRDMESKRKSGLYCSKCDQVFCDDQIAKIKRPELKRRRICFACKARDLRERHKEWRSRNPDKIRKNRELNRERNRESVRKWKKSNKNKVNSYARKYRVINLESRREYERKYRLKVKNEKIAHLIG